LCIRHSLGLQDDPPAAEQDDDSVAF